MRLDVAMRDAASMSIAQSVGHLARNGQGVGDGKLVFAGEPLAQRLPFHLRHHVDEEAVRLARVVQRQDMRVSEVRRGLNLAQEPLGARRGGQLGP